MHVHVVRAGLASWESTGTADTAAGGYRQAFSCATDAIFSMSHFAHPIDLEIGALKAHRRRVRSSADLTASFEEVDGHCFIAVREHGAVVEAYQVQRNQLRRAKRIPAAIW